MSVHVVVARYSEDLTWLAEWQRSVVHNPLITIFVYNKGAEDDAAARQFRLLFNHWIQLPNVGREGQTYLHHICSHYDALPQTVVFLQGRIDDHTNLGVDHYIGKAQREGISYTDIHVLNSDWKGRITHTGKYLTEMQSGRMSSARWTMLECWEMMFPNRGAPSILPVFWTGLFGVNRKRILTHPLNLYERLNSWLIDSSDPEMGHYVERFWYTLFAANTDYVVVVSGGGYPPSNTNTNTNTNNSSTGSSTTTSNSSITQPSSSSTTTSSSSSNSNADTSTSPTTQTAASPTAENTPTTVIDVIKDNFVLVISCVILLILVILFIYFAVERSSHRRPKRK